MNTSELFACLQERMPAGSLSAGPGEPAAARHELLRQARPPLCIVRPGNAGELDAIVRYANETGLTLAVTSSTGRHRRGGIANATEHVLVDLSGWKKIDLIDRRNRVCRVEPGVTYRELAIALDPHGLTVPMPLAPRDGKSVLAAVMDREPGTWPRVQWDAADPVCSTEFTFGSGERFRTGAAGGPGSIEQQRAAGGAQKHPAGPSQADFHRLVQGSQGTLGIVHWITLRAEIRPARPEAYLIGVEWLDDLIETVYGVQRGLLGEQSFIMNRTAAAWLMCAEDRQFFAEMRRSLPAFVCLQVIAGLDRLPEGRAAYHGQEIVRIAGERGLWLEESIGKLSAGALYDRATWPCGETDWRDDLTGGCLSIFFQSTLDRMPGLLKVFADAAAEFGIPEAEIGAYVQPVVQNHACHIELLVPCDPGDLARVERLRDFEREATVR
ncbi:MAG: FAD-binding oxidoreductase, partial [Nitrososphaerales archaeon]